MVPVLMEERGRLCSFKECNSTNWRICDMKIVKIFFARELRKSLGRIARRIFSRSIERDFVRDVLVMWFIPRRAFIMKMEENEIFIKENKEKFLGKNFTIFQREFHLRSFNKLIDLDGHCDGSTYRRIKKAKGMLWLAVAGGDSQQAFQATINWHENYVMGAQSDRSILISFAKEERAAISFEWILLRQNGKRQQQQQRYQWRE